jgi:hypothetical protein
MLNSSEVEELEECMHVEDIWRTTEWKKKT